jgi:hypothetical protein
VRDSEFSCLSCAGGFETSTQNAQGKVNKVVIMKAGTAKKKTEENKSKGELVEQNQDGLEVEKRFRFVVNLSCIVVYIAIGHFDLRYKKRVSELIFAVFVRGRNRRFGLDVQQYCIERKERPCQG